MQHTFFVVTQYIECVYAGGTCKNRWLLTCMRLSRYLAFHISNYVLLFLFLSCLARSLSLFSIGFSSTFLGTGARGLQGEISDCTEAQVA